jgi:RNA polymerase sigma factor (TIGR02999 family)
MLQPTEEAPINEVTRILSALGQGQQHAAEELLPLVYNALRQLAAQKLAHEKPGQTLQATALVHEAFLRLVDCDEPQMWANRSHFLVAASEAMRRLLVESARRKQAIKRGGGACRVEFEPADSIVMDELIDLLALDEALVKFAQDEPLKAKLVQLRFFAGLTMREVAEVLGISLATAERHWTFARTWLFAELSDEELTDSSENRPRK